MSKLTYCLRAIPASLLILTDWWNLKKKAYSARENSIWAIAYDLKMRLNSACIGSHSQFSNKPYLVHGLSGIFISEQAKIGENATIFQHVTIGSNKLQGSKTMGGAPTIGNNCYIGAGAILIGKITIGDNVRIGAGAVVAMDVPSNSTVVCQKPRVILRTEDHID